MNNMLVGYTGFVGSNLKDQINFDYLVNSKNINKVAGTCVDLLVIAAGDARKWFANQNPDIDLIHIQNLYRDVSQIEAKKVILFSTVDVYSSKDGVYEGEFNISSEPYGKHRKLFEEMICSHFADVTIIRLPGLFGSGLKKNIIFDILNKRDISGFNPNSHFQWFFLKDLKRVIDFCSKHSLTELNVTAAPISVADLCIALHLDTESVCEDANLVYYNVCSKYASEFGGVKDYLYSKEETLELIVNYATGDYL
ncbi:Rossmann-fold NAD(P)-binding domain-containing protein [Shewanella fidelis]|uniref:NAD(P)-dependent oxidoreductase n=1 Tax=Shewanella fidelis TaxID=173509 RepID=A0AAW8NMI3_9GAMM|nr:NAD(P)-dependent oxidoreductase [Shewanella fidelis]MDR8524423.1 NAD(P)-dependent oxidoreductase [Shewanella fidelis]MDW4811899.1 NAD(P)-dependent oxidoreductase [Shewanella fidelis]MDW4817162.1 NAD(P)-dependent oxidoreductase [Shewanella fidelis]MDW4821232.1 NAD(P)-dependent oxidoreductase [Shewanella fidelis]MDW4822505.1 NAD(P)-dependent oxidoreductase [Shewanella fidelis]